MEKLASKSTKHSKGLQIKKNNIQLSFQSIHTRLIYMYVSFFLRKYLPQLKKFPEKYIYEPWTAPLSVQQAAGCIIGKDYPKRIVVHETVSKINIKRIAEAYARNKAEKDENNSEIGK